jgi:predicted nucleic acid-binding protein
MMGGLEKMKIIIDTNLWISFLLKGKVYKDLLEILASEKTTLISSQLSINEFTSVATRPKF